MASRSSKGCSSPRSSTTCSRRGTASRSGCTIREDPRGAQAAAGVQRAVARSISTVTTTGRGRLRVLRHRPDRPAQPLRRRVVARVDRRRLWHGAGRRHPYPGGLGLPAGRRAGESINSALFAPPSGGDDPLQASRQAIGATRTQPIDRNRVGRRKRRTGRRPPSQPGEQPGVQLRRDVRRIGPRPPLSAFCARSATAGLSRGRFHLFQGISPEPVRHPGRTEPRARIRRFGSDQEQLALIRYVIARPGASFAYRVLGGRWLAARHDHHAAAIASPPSICPGRTVTVCRLGVLARDRTL